MSPRDFFFQIFLAILGLFIGVATPFVPGSTLKVVAGILAALLIGISCAWVGYEVGRRQPLEPTAMSCAEYGIRIISPKQGASVFTEHFAIAGTFDKKPPDGWLRLYLIPPDRKSFWPQFPVQIDPVNNTWTADGSLKGQPPLEASFAIAVVGESGRILSDHYWEVGRQTNAWVPLSKLTSDTLICAEVFLRRT